MIFVYHKEKDVATAVIRRAAVLLGCCHCDGERPSVARDHIGKNMRTETG